MDHRVDNDMIQTSVANAIVLNGTEVTLEPLSGDHDKVETCITVSAASALMQDNVVLVETPRGLLLSVGDGVGGVSYGSITATAELQGRQLLATGIPAALLGSVQQDGIIDSQGHKIVFETQTHGDTVSLCEQVLDGSDTLVCGAELQLTTSGMPKKKKGGWPKGKKRKIIPDVKAPRAPVTGYVLYAMERRQEIKESNPEIPFAEVTKVLGQEWSAMMLEKKHKYLDEAAADKNRYIDELKAFQQSDTYQNFLKKRKLKELHCGEETTSPSLDDDSLANLIDLEDDCASELYCRVCNQYFSSQHNKKEHLFGRQHLQAITGELQKEIQRQTEQQQSLSGNSLMGADLNNDSITSLSDHSEMADLSPKTSGPVDVSYFMQGFLQKNLERESEIKQLSQFVKTSQEDNLAMCKQIQHYKEYESKLEQDIGTLKAYGAALSAQIDVLKMVPTLFGVINF